ncbi:MAG TPA: nitroreductase family protein, partial [Marinagarivorans sp.]|nr:nitroreductase family protein [Marinagarivorans sp.]
QSPWRYNQLYQEAGLIGQSLYIDAEAIGLRGTGIGCFFDEGVHEVLGINSEALQSLYHFTLGGPIIDTRIISLPPYPERT